MDGGGSSSSSSSCALKPGKEFTNVCRLVKSRAEMLGKQNYLPGPNVLTICCIVLAGLDQPSTGPKLQLQAAAVRPALRPQPASKELYSSVAAWLSGRRGAEWPSFPAFQLSNVGTWTWTAPASLWSWTVPRQRSSPAGTGRCPTTRTLEPAKRVMSSLQPTGADSLARRRGGGRNGCVDSARGDSSARKTFRRPSTTCRSCGGRRRTLLRTKCWRWTRCCGMLARSRLRWRATYAI